MLHMLHITLTDGSAITGHPNYTTATHAEIILTDGTFLWLERALIANVKRVKR